MSAIKWGFIGPNGFRHGWRFLIFVAGIIVLVQFLEQPAVTFLADRFHVVEGTLSAPAIIVRDAVDLILILIVTGAAALFERRRVDGYGLPANEAFRGLFWNGAVVGLAATVFVAIGMLVTSGMRIHGIALHGRDLTTSPLLWPVAMLFFGLAEEYLFRGYALQSLWRGAGFWPAAL